MEIEAKFAVPDEMTLERLVQADRLAGYTLLPAKIKRVHDTFMDTPDRAVLASDLQELAALLADDDSRAAKVADSIAEKLRAVGQGVASMQLQKRIAKYEFEEALDALKEAARALDIPLSQGEEK